MTHGHCITLWRNRACSRHDTDRQRRCPTPQPVGIRGGLAVAAGREAVHDLSGSAGAGLAVLFL